MYVLLREFKTQPSRPGTSAAKFTLKLWKEKLPSNPQSAVGRNFLLVRIYITVEAGIQNTTYSAE